MVTIVGAGLAGSILSRVLTANKIKHVVFDCEKPWRSSIISENLFSKTWVSTLGEQVVINGMRVLESVVDIKTIPFRTKGGVNEVYYVHPKNILVKNYIRKEVNIDTLSGIVIDCRGFWASYNNLFTMRGLAGQGLFIQGNLKQEPVMNFVSPYVHQKLFQWEDGVMWYGDSTCIDYHNYIKKVEFYSSRCLWRATKLLGKEVVNSNVVYGIRPQVLGYKGYLKFVNRNYIINTGGWKCGLVIYADQASKILNYLK